MSSIICHNVTIRKKNKKRENTEKILEKEDRALLQEASCILVSDQIQLAQEEDRNSSNQDGALRAQKPILEVSKWVFFFKC